MQLTRFSGPRSGQVYRALRMLSEYHHMTRSRSGSSDHAKREDTDQCQHPRPTKRMIYQSRLIRREKTSVSYSTGSVITPTDNDRAMRVHTTDT